MDLGRLRINQLSGDGWAWYQDYLDVLDAYDVESYAKFLADDVEVQFNNDLPLVGLEAARIGLSRFWGSISAMGYVLLHEPLNVYGTDQHFVLEALNHYDNSDGVRITVRATAWTDRDDGGKVTAVRLYQDLSPIYAQN